VGSHGVVAPSVEADFVSVGSVGCVAEAVLLYLQLEG